MPHGAKRLTAIFSAALYAVITFTATTQSKSYSIGDQEYLRIFTKAYHQVWTEILSQGGFAEPNFEAKTNYRPNDGSESVFVQGMKPKARHFHSALFYNGSMYMFGGLDKDMYFNDMWEYKLPLFASDRSKWYEQISFWQRDIQWLVINNNRYTHNIIKDIYTSVCKDMFDGPSAAARSSNWELATDGLTQVDKESGHYRSDPASDSLAEGEQVSSIFGGGPVHTALPYEGVDPTGNKQQWEWLKEDVWVCEEMKLRFDFMNTPNIDLIQDKKRPSARFGVGSVMTFSDVHFTPETSVTTCDLYGCTREVLNPILRPEPTTGQMYSTLTNIDRATQRRIYPHGSLEPVCQWNAAKWSDKYTEPSYGGWTYTHPTACRPQMLFIGGYDVNDMFLIDIWIYDVWNNSWSTTQPAPHTYVAGPPAYPRSRKFASVNVLRDDVPFKPAGNTVPDEHQNYTELVYVMGGEAAYPTGVFQDVWAWSREYNQWIDLRPIGRVPTARVYDSVIFAIDTMQGPNGPVTGYVFGGTFGGFKIDVLKYIPLKNRFANLYALGAKPSARSYFSTVLYVDAVFVFGGRGWKTVDNIDKDDMWIYNITVNSWFRSEPTGIFPNGRFGHSGIAFGGVLMVFGGYSTPELQELGTGDMNDVWRFDVKIGALLADNKFLDNAGGWVIYQNEVRGDTIIPYHCDDYASKLGTYFGPPCRLAYEGSTRQILFIDGLHNDTTTDGCSLMGCDGVGYFSAPKNYLRTCRKMYQGRMRYEYTKVYPNEDAANQYSEVCDTLYLNSTANPTINVNETLPCGDLELYSNGTYPPQEACALKIAFFGCAKKKGCMDMSRNFLCTSLLKGCNVDGGVLCSARRDATFDTKDDVLLVGKYQILSFDILDELVPYPRRYTLVDIDLDESKGWRVHGTNGTQIPTRSEFLNVLETLQLLLVRADYWASIHFKQRDNFDYLGLVNEPLTTVRIGGEDAKPELRHYFNNSLKGGKHNQTHKLAEDGSVHPYGTLPNRPGTFESDWQSEGIWKFMKQPEPGDPTIPMGRRETHGEIVGVRSFELFEATDPMFP